MQNDQAKQLFNEGVAASLSVGDLLEKRDFDAASEASQLAIDKFREAAALEPQSAAALGALGNELYLRAGVFGDGDFAQATECLTKALQAEPDNVAFLCVLGLSQANQGELPAARETFERALQLDPSNDTRDHIATAMGELGNRAGEYGTSLVGQGQQEEGAAYQRFAIGALMLAFEVDQERREIARQISELAREVGDVETAVQFATLASR